MTWSKATGPLRQGDICVLPGFPIWNLDTTRRSVGPHDVTDRYIMPLHKAFEWDGLSGSVAVAVCSHDCDIENPRTRTGIIVAPLVRVPSRPGDDRYKAILASSDVTEQLDYVNMFPVVYSDTDRQIEAVIDFSAMTSMAKAETAIKVLLDARALGCDDETREAIGAKLAMFLGRKQQDPRPV